MDILSSAVQRAASVVPSKRQLNWHSMEFYGFIHFGMNTFTGLEWGDGTASPSLFHPKHLDAAQWVRAAASAGMRGLILTCKHHDGFCLWPSLHTSYSVAESPWKNGQGDVVREVAEACRNAGLRFGVYLSPWDRHETSYGSGAAYNAFYLAQLRELLTHYGDLFCVWLDGACGEGPGGRVQSYDWPAFYALIRELQPNAVISICGPDVRWCGNEAGHVRISEWCVVPAALRDPDYTAAHSQQTDDAAFSRRFSAADDELGSRAVIESAKELAWYPAEVDTSLRPGWFYHPEEDSRVRTPEELFDLYLRTVGGNASLLLNLSPSPEGRIAETDERALRELGTLLKSRLSRDLALTACFFTNSSAPGHSADCARAEHPGCWRADGRTVPELTLRFRKPVCARYVSLREELTLGQHIENGCILADGNVAARFTTVGSRRICVLEQPVFCRNLTIRIESTRAEPALREISVY